MALPRNKPGKRRRRVSGRRAVNPPLTRSEGSRKPRRAGTRPPSRSGRRVDITISRPPLLIHWTEIIAAEEWALYRQAMEAVRDASISFLLGGGFALAAYTGRWRDTKDIDFYIMPDDRERAVAALRKEGFKDYFERLPYDRNWIARNYKEDVIVDLIWAMANQRAQVDPLWLERAGILRIRSQDVLIAPPEEFLWCKLYILQRDHCDWTDVFNLLYAYGQQIDWDHLIWRLGEDTPLLKGALTVYAWLCPGQAIRLPQSLWTRLGLDPPEKSACPPAFDRVRLLDTRDWFTGRLAEHKKLDV
jgi:hypothetical protein